MYPYEEKEVFTNNRRIYYTDYSSPKDLLTQIKPSKVVFMGLDGLQTIAINIQCRKLNIPTYFMEHGSATLSIDDFRDFKTDDRNLLKESLTHKLGAWLFTFKFIIKALGIKYIYALPLLTRFQLQKLKMHPLLALEKNRTSLRVPSKYIVFSREDVRFYKHLNHARDEDFIVLGNLEINVAIQMAKETGVSNDGYLLYIETPLSIIEGNEFDINKISIEENNAILSSMNAYAIKNDLKLIVKLHPYSFSNSFYLQHPNIIYEKGDKKESLILGANAIIFFNSSLAIPSLYFKPCCMFMLDRPDKFQSSISELKICTVINYQDMIDDPANISFFIPDQKTKQAYIDKYIGAGVDGKGLQRLRQALLD